MRIKSILRISILGVLLGLATPSFAIGIFSTSPAWNTLGKAVDSLRTLELLRPFSIPTSAMAPTISSGDHIMMEGLVFLWRKPQRNDVIVFKTNDIDSLPIDTFYVKRVVGLPGERLRLEDGKLFVNDTHIKFRNTDEEIHYTLLPIARYLASSDDDVLVPEDHYFVLGDNSPNSADSRIWGFVPSRNIIGRAFCCYWPANRMGRIR